MRLKRFINNYDLILEKVSKKDISSILNSTNVIVGAEFEFISRWLEDEIENFEASESLYSDARDAYWQYVSDLEDYWAGEEEDPPPIPLQLFEYDPDLYKKYEEGDEIPEPPPPPYVDVLDDDDEWERFVEKNIKKSNPPFKKIKVYAEHGTDAMSGWVAEQDGSLSSAGIEIKSPPMTLKEFMDICPKMFKWIDKYGYTNEDCGFHIHMSLKNVPDLVKNLDLVKLTLFTDEDYIWKFFPDRIDNQYTISMKKELENVGYIDKSEWKQFIDYKKLVNKVEESHYNAINWEGLSDDKQHIEFRYLGGPHYHNKWNSIRVIIAQYAYNLDLSCNPKSHMKEYAHKIQRIINKIEMIRYELIIMYLKDWLEIDMSKWTTNDTIDIKNIIRKYIKKYESMYRSMSGIYKKSLEAYSSVDVSDDLKAIREEVFKEYSKRGGTLRKKTITKMLWIE